MTRKWSGPLRRMAETSCTASEPASTALMPSAGSITPPVRPIDAWMRPRSSAAHCRRSRSSACVDSSSLGSIVSVSRLMSGW